MSLKEARMYKLCVSQSKVCSVEKSPRTGDSGSKSGREESFWDQLSMSLPQTTRNICIE